MYGKNYKHILDGQIEDLHLPSKPASRLSDIFSFLLLTGCKMLSLAIGTLLSSTGARVHIPDRKMGKN